MTDKADDTSVRVAVRIRPQLPRERIDMCQVCTSVPPGENQVMLGKDKAFTYDHVFDIDGTQDQVYQDCAKTYIDGCFEGYNATIFAYGQTGSGKTYTMGTGFDLSISPEEVGIIPRAVEHLFNGIEERRQEAFNKNEPPPDFKVNAQFMELYNEEIIDLLDTTRDPGERGRKSHIKIHEDAHGGIYTVGITTRPVNSLQDTMQFLKIGALSRTTASTNMNAQSSRSHAIFTLHIKQQRIVQAEPEEDEEGNTQPSEGESLNEFETLTAKFHFVDLAGSERLKRTGATGDRAKEGISINCGLLALGNVISALGDKAKRGSHVPYRDSKLTRLLQDSLGGNSRTVMIACVSPSDRDFMETLNSLKYANRARNIKNKVVVNQDKTSKQISELRHLVQQLQVELEEYRLGKRMVDPDGVETVNDMFHENTMLQTENSNLRQRIKAMQETVEALTSRNTELLSERAMSSISNMDENSSQDEVAKLIGGYIKEIEELRGKLVESEAMVDSLRSRSARTPSRMATSPMMISHTAGPNMSMDFTCSTPEDTVSAVISQAKRDVKLLKKKVRLNSQSSDKDLVSEEEKQDVEDNQEKVKDGDEDEDEASDEEENDEDEEDDVAEDMSSESESDEADSDVFDTDNLHENLADLTCEITIKEKLIEELENSQRRLHTLKSQYEHKLVSLQTQIKETEMERDKVLTNMGSINTQTEEKTRKIKEQFQKKINDLQSDLKKVQAAKKEHAKLLRNQAHYEKQLNTLQKDLSEMKKFKVKLINQIKEDTAKNRASELLRNKEIAQLKKQQRLKESKITKLESEKKQKDIVLRRKQEEVESLRKRQKQDAKMSQKAAGRVGKYEKPPTVGVSPIGRRKKKEFSPKAAKQKWDNVEKNVSSIIVKRQTLSHMERDMERWLKSRNKLIKNLEKCQRRRDRSLVENKPDSAEIIQDLEDQMETLKDNIIYVQDNINDCQSSIMQMEESKEDEPDTTNMFSAVSLDEAHYLLEHFMTLAIGKGLLAAQKDAENKELLAKLHQERMEGTFQRDMLQYLIQDHVDIEIDDSLLRMREDSDTGSASSSRSASPVDSAMIENQVEKQVENQVQPIDPVTAMMLMPQQNIASNDSIGSSSSVRGKDKARRKTATPQDLLGVGAGPGVETAAPLVPVPETPEEDKPKRAKVNGSVPENLLMPPPQPKTLSTHTRQNGVPSRQNSSGNRNDAGPSPSLMRKSYPSYPSKSNHSAERSPTMRRRDRGSGSSGSLSHQSSVSDNADFTPPSSPNLNRRNNRDENVFSRLTGSTQFTPPHSNRGSINPTNSKVVKTSPLIHSYTADGHSKAVLSVCATEDLLFSSSKDRTAKIWDLQTGAEVMTLSGHPNNVVSVKYSEETKLVYTVSTYFIKVWDVREGHKCIKTLSSAGLTTEGSIPINSSSRQVTCPPGETNINDIALNSTGAVLYSAAGNNVRIWDLRCFKSVGKLSGGHQAAVMVLAVDDTDTADGNICVVTGSKDHYIKVFDVMEDTVGIMTPKYNLEPPHYDGIQSLCLMGDLLFSGSRDTCIKKWDLAEQKLAQAMNNSHKDWICGLAFMPGGNCLLSGCRGGYLKLWHIDNCTQLGEIKAHHSPINAITTNSGLIFTASNDRTVSIWRPRGSFEASDSSDRE